MLKLTAVVCGLVLLGLGLGGIVRAPQEYFKDQNSIASLAQRTKNQGKTQVSVPGPIVDYPGMNQGLDAALQNYSAVVAEPVESKSYIEDSNNIRTAYKFRILEIVSQRDAVFCNTCPSLNDVSAKLQPALQNEFILELSGGTLTVDGVEVTMINTGIPKFENGKSYLMFISFTPGGMARLAAGPSGVFRITSGDSLEPMGNAKRPLPTQIETRFSKSLSRLKQATKP